MNAKTESQATAPKGAATKDVSGGGVVGHIQVDREVALLNVARCAKELAKATRDCAKAADARRALGTDCTRARMTSANARWATLADERDRKQAEFNAALLLIGVLP